MLLDVVKETCRIRRTVHGKVPWLWVFVSDAAFHHLNTRGTRRPGTLLFDLHRARDLLAVLKDRGELTGAPLCRRDIFGKGI